MIFALLVPIAIVIILAVFIAKKFSYVAEEKGYDQSQFFWICFFLGIVGWLLVILLPDLHMRRLFAEIRDKE